MIAELCQCPSLAWLTAFGFAFVSPLSAEEPSSSPTNSNPPIASSRLTSDYDLEDPFDPGELRTLAEKPSRTRSENRRLMLLILHAGINQDESFEDLLEDPELKEATNVRLALAGYDYLLNQSEAALDHILARIAVVGVGADVDSIVVLSTLDEWDRSIRAFWKHFVRTDGAGASCMMSFRETRAYLYPEKYLELREVMEAPIEYGRRMPELK